MQFPIVQRLAMCEDTDASRSSITTIERVEKFSAAHQNRQHVRETKNITGARNQAKARTLSG